MEVAIDYEQMTALKNRLDQQTGMVAQVLTTIRGQLANTNWVGPASNRFRESWQSDFEPMLQRLQQQLDEASREGMVRRDSIYKAGS